MSKHCFLDGFLEERLYVIQLEGFVDPKGANKYASSSDPSIDWCKHHGVGINALMRWSKLLGLSEVYEKLVLPKKWVGAL